MTAKMRQIRFKVYHYTKSTSFYCFTI